MKRNIFSTIALALVIVMMGGCGNNVWDELPSGITAFVTKFFPFGEVESFQTGNNGSTVKIKNGATLKFDPDQQWTEVNGNGSTLPGDFLFDQLPPVLYRYIEEMERVDGVYCVVRTPSNIMVKFLDSEIDYDRATETITYPAATSNIASMF